MKLFYTSEERRSLKKVEFCCDRMSRGFSFGNIMTLHKNDHQEYAELGPWDAECQFCHAPITHEISE